MKPVVDRWRSRVARARGFAGEDWRVLSESLVMLLGVSIALRLVAFPRLVAWAKRPAAADGTSWSLSRIQRTASLVALASRATGTRCLARALTLTRVLARRGVVSDLRIGVRPENRRLEAHAWVEWMGTALNDSPGGLERYSAFESPIGGSSNA